MIMKRRREIGESWRGRGRKKEECESEGALGKGDKWSLLFL
jgi:hypothetical protein